MQLNAKVYLCTSKRVSPRNSGWFPVSLGFPQTVGAVDGTHTPILRPQESSLDYYNRKGYNSILMQGVVDFRGLFMDVNIGWPGKVHDAKVFVNSSFYHNANTGNMFPNWTQSFQGVDVPLIMLGDPAYPLLPWLMKSYLENLATTPQESYFKYRQSRARMVVENVFCHLNGRWRCLMKRIDAHVSNVPSIVGACVVLHNIREVYGDYCPQDWIVNETTCTCPTNPLPTLSEMGSRSNSVAVHIRNATKDYICK